MYSSLTFSAPLVQHCLINCVSSHDSFPVTRPHSKMPCFLISLLGKSRSLCKTSRHQLAACIFSSPAVPLRALSLKNNLLVQARWQCSWASWPGCPLDMLECMPCTGQELRATMLNTQATPGLGEPTCSGPVSGAAA